MSLYIFLTRMPSTPSNHQKSNQNRKPHAHSVNKPHFAKDVRINLRRAKFKSKHESTNLPYEDEPESEYKNKLKPQPKSSWLSYDDIPDVVEDGKDFESLINAPVSEGGHFSFKGEKDWIFDISQSSELFSLNKRLLNAAVSCIPLNECIGLEDTYFSKNQLSYIKSDAKNARIEYEKISNDLFFATTIITDKRMKHESNDILGNTISQEIKTATLEKVGEAKNSQIENLEDDLDFLLTLNEPIKSGPMTMPEISTFSSFNEERNQYASVPTKPVDLESWLDSILDD